MKKTPLIPHSTDREVVPFADAAEAIFWFRRAMSALEKRGNFTPDGARPCEISDMAVILNRLAREGRFSAGSARALAKYAARQERPDTSAGASLSEVLYWHDAIEVLETVLRRKGIVGEPPCS
ncbi:hypothetical protein FACS1894186_3160 [Alphaproteobacteria bacterium]|nr:hypothetical protein FACS1894186_3160 [Alphaproteobacteria bacterium]